MKIRRPEDVKSPAERFHVACEETKLMLRLDSMYNEALNIDLVLMCTMASQHVDLHADYKMEGATPEKDVVINEAPPIGRLKNTRFSNSG